jgi:hypothetical protein
MANVVAKACFRAALTACIASCANANAGTVTVTDKTRVKTPGSAPLFKIERHGKWGFIDRTGQVVIRPRFDEVGDFFDGRAPVRMGRKWGYISENGALAIRPQYQSAGLFRDARAIVSIGGRFGLIDTEGHVPVPPRYEAIRLLKVDRVAVAVRGTQGDPQPNALRWAIIDTDGQTVTPPLYNDIGEEYSEGLIQAAIAEPTPDGLNTRNTWGFIDTGGTWVLSPRFESMPGGFLKDRAVFLDETTNRGGMVDRTGRVICPPVFVFLWPSRDDESLIGERDDDDGGGTHWVILDSNFDVIAAVEADQVFGFVDGLAAFSRHERWGFIDTTGGVVVPPVFSNAYPHTDGLARVELEDESWGYVDRAGNLAIAARYDGLWEFEDGLAIVELDGEDCYINTSGDVVARNIGIGVWNGLIWKGPR